MAEPAPAAALLTPQSIKGICTRLSSIHDLRLPAAMCRDQAAPPAADAINAYLTDLLERDAAVFLERYGDLLTVSELEIFQALRGAYEINYWLSQAEQKAAATSAAAQTNGPSTSGRVKAASKTAANRRLAYMHKLEQQGEYFAEAAMRAREPLVWHEYIGQYEGLPAPPTGPVPGEGFAGSLLAAHEEVIIRARLQQQLEEEDCQLSEHESDSDDEPEQQQHDRQLQQNGTDPNEDAAMQEAAGVLGTGPKPNRTSNSNQQQGSASCRSQPHQQQDMTTGAMRRRRQEFLEEMQSRFLLGMDAAHQEYAVIDADVSLDEAWAAQQAQDAEDAYFDAD